MICHWKWNNLHTNVIFEYYECMRKKLYWSVMRLHVILISKSTKQALEKSHVSKVQQLISFHCWILKMVRILNSNIWVKHCEQKEKFSQIFSFEIALWNKVSQASNNRVNWCRQPRNFHKHSVWIVFWLNFYSTICLTHYDTLYCSTKV